MVFSTAFSWRPYVSASLAAMNLKRGKESEEERHISAAALFLLPVARVRHFKVVWRRRGALDRYKLQEENAFLYVSWAASIFTKLIDPESSASTIRFENASVHIAVLVLGPPVGASPGPARGLGVKWSILIKRSESEAWGNMIAPDTSVGLDGTGHALRLLAVQVHDGLACTLLPCSCWNNTALQQSR